MFKKSLQNNKVVRLIAIVLTVAMLMTVCMTEAFAATSVHTTYYGYQVDASVSYTSTPKFTFELMYELTAGLEMKMYASFTDGYGHYEAPQYRTSETASYVLRSSFTPQDANTYNKGYQASAQCWVYYNGATSPCYYIERTVS